ncbi:uncharacterized protein BXZ73DRAFT_50137, partial [Epithele typhae]|uniref:uncharacterized protein n=1 Tax=Epithele typhae TaxID=378194 RepID=UPI0020082835
EFPFPRMPVTTDSPRTASSGSSLQTRSSTSSQSKSIRTASSSKSPQSLPHVRVERERSPDDHRHRRFASDRDTLRDADGDAASIQAKLLAHLYAPPPRDSRALRTALALTTERLEGETRRAEDAERRVIEVLRKLRASHEATMLAQAEASRTKEELTLYKYRLDDAQREITRANDLIHDLEEQKLEAEAEAARARSTARRYREQQLIIRARAEGRDEGFEEGLVRGKDLGFQEAIGSEPLPPRETVRRYPQARVEVVADEEEEEVRPTPQVRTRTPAPADIRVRDPGPSEYRTRTPGASTSSDSRTRRTGPSTSSSSRVTPPPRQPSRCRITLSRTSNRPNVPDIAHYAAILPVPTLTTPVNAPSPSYSRADTPAGMPIPYRAPRDLDMGEVPAPIVIHERAPSPIHPPVDIPPDGWIPYASGEQIILPPPHELSRPVSPVSSVAPSLAPRSRSVEPPPPTIIVNTAPSPALAPHQRDYYVPTPPPGATQPADPPRTREFSYPAAPPPVIPVAPPPNRPISPQSKASTNISQFDIVSAGRHKLRMPSLTAGGRASSSRSGDERERDRNVPSPRGPRSRENLPPVVPPPPQLATVHEEAGTTPLEKLFKNRFRSRSFRDSAPKVATPGAPVPDITVEAPSTASSSRRTSAVTTGTHPAFLSPEQAALPPLAPRDPSAAYSTPVSLPTKPKRRPPPPEPDDFIPPPPDTITGTAPGSLPSDLPPGFVPLTPPMPASTLAAQSHPPPSNTPIPVPPPPNDPLPVPPPRYSVPTRTASNTPVPIPPPSGDPLPIPYNEPRSVRSTQAQAPLPVRQDEPIPIPHRSPGGTRYVEAPIPEGVVYPAAGERVRSPLGSLGESSAHHRFEVRSPSERLSPLPGMPIEMFANLRSDRSLGSLESK